MAFIIIGLIIWLIVVCVQKGKPGMAVLGVLWGWTWVIGAVRVAKPGSTWDRKYYEIGSPKHQLARFRFPEDLR